jgi:hypothetical protein
MKNRIARVKNFVLAHNHGLATTTALAVGAAVTYRQLNNTQLDAAWLRLTMEQAQNLVATPGENCVTYTLPRQIVNVYVDPA